ncbi:MAG: copper-translocating P-type ATPase [Planctomycetes bacterium UTPLA1]|nr:MAG: copper-translocating P-type ATPase [Planctomycetes bacterium UTPLA1]
MTCGACVRRVEDALRSVTGVADAGVQLMSESAIVATGGAAVSKDALVQAVRAIGYDAEVMSGADTAIPGADESAHRERQRRDRQALIQAIGLVLPILAVDHFRHVLWSHNTGSQTAAILLELVLLLMLAFSPAGAPILVGGLRALFFRTPNMDLLITMGFSVATLSSVYGAFIARDEAFVHVHAAAMILGLVCVGRYLETRARGRAASAMKALARHAPRTALVKRDGQVVSTRVEDIAIDDIIVVPVHNAIPADGVIVEGGAAVDEALMTGEPFPVNRTQGDTVLGGTLVVEGQISFRVTATGAQAAVGRIAQLVARAQGSKTKMQRTADRVAAVFTPIVIAAATITFVGWLSLYGRDSMAAAARAAIAVLVVACPCALGLATPVVISVASSMAALRGILVRDAGMLEAMAGIDLVIWDKTGTLTSGKHSVHWIKPLASFNEAQLLALAAAAEQFSTHPIARAIEARARRDSMDLAIPSAFNIVLGGGVTARVEEHDLVIGSLAFLEGQGIADARIVVKHGTDAGPRDTLVGVAVDGMMAGLISLSDATRPSSAQAVKTLKSLGIESELLTGDVADVAGVVAAEVGIKRVSAACSPADKVARIAKARQEGRRVAMVGDGVNDAAALAAADVGIAFGSGTDVASVAAGINLIGSAPGAVPDAVKLSRASLRLIRENLFWAFAYNVIMIPFAAMGRLPPSLAAGAMMLSSLTVVLNALRLGRLWRKQSRTTQRPEANRTEPRVEAQ